MADVEEWLTGLKLTKYIQVFADHGVDSLEKAGALTSDKLTEMGITLQGHRNRILKHLPSAGATDEQQQAQLEQQEQQEQQEQPQEPSQPQTAAPAEQQQDEAEAGPEAAPAPPRPAPKPKPKPKPKPRTDSLSAEQPPAAENNGTPTQQQQQQEEQQHVQEEQQEEEQQQEGEQQVQHGAQSEEDDVQEQANPEPVAAQNTGAASTKEETIDQLDNILGDIENMLGDLDGPHMAEETGQGHDGAQSTKHIDDGDYEHNADTGMASSVAVLSSMQDSDLDDLLADLCSFGTEKYFPHSVRADIEATAQTSQLAGNAKRRLFQEYFSNTARVPDVKGFAQIKEGKKWKKRFCVLRASGVYFSAKGESEASRDLQVYVKFDEHYVCTPLPAFLTKLKAPTHFAIAFRPNIRKRRFEPQDIPTMTFSSDDDRNIWLAGIRFAVFGANLREGYEETCKRFDKLAELGEFNPDTAKQFKAPTRQDVRHVNKKLVQKWQSMRAASSDSPNVSAATGVEFDDFADDSKSGDGKNGEKDSITSQLLQHAWFHGALSRDAAEALLRDYNFAQGAYLVRESTSHPGDYVISLCFESKPHHYKVKKVQGSGGRVSFGLDQGPRFPYLPDLITHYSGNVGRLPTQLALAIPRKN
ncbi:hypothetical protein PTSG_11649 [Salpingoeca rosetta]|uniref:SH2 domain-containing protein n=1 Tax=Salpingoeca rosetta (strain ATCC 50818 / BSB-021) TaxID=946362 RepID=F2TXN0_SALR5|nr:uncharacterized protein PTSG_11649 [Salpingoeca rosetta]EGD76139.1 hypothetical protein PTSG_11649 [Salpingoeca rosetta]|eukprot:XP_004998314.1 hypothetical protein PTSG_11649 [Salpingoeca rosetta]